MVERLTRVKSHGRWSWWLRDERGRRVAFTAERRRQVFTPKKYRPRFIEYVRTFIFRTDEPGVYYGVDVVEVTEVPYDFSEDQADYGLVDPARVSRMKRMLMHDEGLPADVRYAAPVDREVWGGRGTGGWRWVLGGPVGLRWEDLREVRR